MAEIISGEVGPYGERGFIVEWEDNFGDFRERFFTTKRAAEKFAVRIEMDLLNETVTDFNAAIAAMTPQQVRDFNERMRRETEEARKRG
jgi:hypothetical protein